MRRPVRMRAVVGRQLLGGLIVVTWLSASAACGVTSPVDSGADGAQPGVDASVVTDGAVADVAAPDAAGVDAACPSGYTLVGITCTDIDECATGTPCGTASTGCTNTQGSYSCTCSSGYTAPATGGTCTDVNECATGSPCGAFATGCTNTSGSYTVTAHVG